MPTTAKASTSAVVEGGIFDILTVRTLIRSTLRSTGRGWCVKFETPSNPVAEAFPRGKSSVGRGEGIVLYLDTRRVPWTAWGQDKSGQVTVGDTPP